MGTDDTTTPLRGSQWLRDALGLFGTERPFPWQEELLTRFSGGQVERSLDIPTGLGKTAVMAVWLVARACGATLPRRLVYVVDRRAVVDQATEEAERLRAFVDRNPEVKAALGLQARSLPISTLRGQHVDNKEWLENPASPAIIVGTVDMIGSRLLFEGYGTSRKMRPYHAGLLGADALVVLDEAHLVPSFEKLLEAIAQGGKTFGPCDKVPQDLVPPFRLLSLSATGRTGNFKPFGLTAEDLSPGTIPRKRLDATKRLFVRTFGDKDLAEALADEAWRLSEQGTRPIRCLVFCNQRKVAEAAKKAIEARARGDKRKGLPEAKVHTELFVGGRRVFERTQAAQRLKTLGFLAGSKVELDRPAFLFATSAGEVGVDLDADHMVSDLVAWERMIQRLGRVNRRGDGAATVVVLFESSPKKAVQEALAKDSGARTAKEAKLVADYEASQAGVRTRLAPFEHLPSLLDEGADASPGALRELKLRAADDPKLQTVLDAATTPAPLRPALTRALVDAWSLTSLKEHTGRPKVAPWLRGWTEDDKPQTSLVWRIHLPARAVGRASASDKEVAAFFEAAPPHASEILETETYRVIEWLAARTKARAAGSPEDSDSGGATGGDDQRAPTQRDEVVAVALTPAGEVAKVFRLGDLLLDDGDKKVRGRREEDLERVLIGASLVVDARFGGLSRDGLLDATRDEPPLSADGCASWMQDGSASSGEVSPVTGFRVRVVGDDSAPAADARWRERFRFARELSEDGEPRNWLVVEKWRSDSTTEDDRSASQHQRLCDHHAWTEAKALELARRLFLPDNYREMLAVAGSLHDPGKDTRRWQTAFHAKSEGGPYAKTRGPVNTKLLDGYRHEFGSLPTARADPRLRALPDDLRDLALHLIAAHHGFARPIIGASGCEDAPPSALEDRQRDVALRFARLQKRWGPWGLAWWETLLRAADQQASRDNDAQDSDPKEGI